MSSQISVRRTVGVIILARTRHRAAGRLELGLTVHSFLLLDSGYCFEN